TAAAFYRFPSPGRQKFERTGSRSRGGALSARIADGRRSPTRRVSGVFETRRVGDRRSGGRGGARRDAFQSELPIVRLRQPCSCPDAAGVVMDTDTCLK